MRVIRFFRAGCNYGEIAFSEEHLRAKLGGDMAYVIVPAEPWYKRLWLRFFPRQGYEAPVDGVMRTFELKGRRV